MGNERTALIVMLVLILVVVSISDVEIAKGDAETIVVPDDYASIKEAILAASEGDTVYVKKGTYDMPINQTLTINKAISLVGEDAENTIINLYPPWILKMWHPVTPDYGYDNPVTIEANNVTFSDFTITSNGGFVLLEGDGIQMMDNIMNTGIFVMGNRQNISRNITPWISCYGSSSTFDGNSINDYFSIGSGSLNIVCGNTVTNGSRISVAGKSNNVFNNTVKNCEDGLLVVTASDNILHSNWITNNYRGIVLQYGSSNNVFYANYVADNDVGVSVGYRFSAGGNNTFYHNNFVNNSFNGIVYPDNPVNVWDDGSEGNYWDDYTGIDSDIDGIGDTPYILYGNNRDNYPLMNPIDITTIPEFPSWAILVFILVGSLSMVVFRKKVWR